ELTVLRTPSRFGIDDPAEVDPLPLEGLPYFRGSGHKRERGLHAYPVEREGLVEADIFGQEGPLFQLSQGVAHGCISSSLLNPQAVKIHGKTIDHAARRRVAARLHRDGERAVPGVKGQDVGGHVNESLIRFSYEQTRWPREGDRLHENVTGPGQAV